jgi:hypothetical protein
MKPSFFKQLLAALLGGAARTTAAAVESGAGFKTIGISAGAGAIAGVLEAIVAHPAAKLPPVTP